MAGVFERDLAASGPVSLERLRGRPWSQRLTDRFWASFASQL
jgi:hypothetical protein